MDRVTNIYRDLIDDPMGRLSRNDYWTIWFFNLLALIVAAYFVPWDGVYVLISGALWIADLLFSIKRYHDSGRKGWWLLCPLANIIFLFYDSTEDNEWGPKPI